MIPPRLVPRVARAAAVLALLLSLASLVMYLASCGPSSRERVLRGTLTSVNTARAAFVVWDDQTQAKIVAQAPSLAAGREALEAHRARRDRVLSAFEGAYRTLALAATEPEADRLVAALMAAHVLWGVYQVVVGQTPPGTLELPAGAGGD